MPADVSGRIRAKIAQYAENPTQQANDVRALKGEPGILRLRVGDWRILFTDEGEVIAVVRVAPR